jgi:hypothetical protein
MSQASTVAGPRIAKINITPEISHVAATAGLQKTAYG